MEAIERIKRLAIIAMFSDDELMESLVLKGGNALDIIYDIGARASLDLDFSIPEDFPSQDLARLEDKMRQALEKTFRTEGYHVIDVSLEERPERGTPGTPDFWGGYALSFKVVTKDVFDGLSGDHRKLRLHALDVGPGSKKIYTVEISKHECCSDKRETELENYVIYVYTPEMIVIEKLRAICQQMEEYTESIGKSHRTARARDFFDIYTAIEHFKIDLTSPLNLQLLRAIFACKHVPLQLIGDIEKHREYHRLDFAAVENTVRTHVQVKSFDFYFDYVVSLSRRLCQALGVV